MNNNDLESWSHKNEPINVEYLQDIGDALIDPMAASVGHKNTLRVCRDLYDEVRRLQEQSLTSGELKKAIDHPHDDNRQEYSMVRHVVAKGPNGWRRFDCADNDAAEIEIANELQCGVQRFQVSPKSQADLLVVLLSRGSSKFVEAERKYIEGSRS
ncbi:hypothetical protein LCGC14_0547150 [marine sediment metagenome]|uniref:Uncharacterized protein n=1 Tax=marine sediment metagenome TaxID=412755 RepID=A0A0F9UZ85_9ZZZZ